MGGTLPTETNCARGDIGLTPTGLIAGLATTVFAMGLITGLGTMGILRIGCALTATICGCGCGHKHTNTTKDRECHGGQSST
jgi:hypothetical protein